MKRIVPAVSFEYIVCSVDFKITAVGVSNSSFKK
jgi:hypothetical protein